MEARHCPFARIINGTTQFVIPVFQRDYGWSEDHCEQFWSDILHAARSGADHTHFIGSVVSISTKDSSAGFTRNMLIDGQQRLTTLILLLTALRDHLAATGWQGNEESPNVKRLDGNFLRNLQEDGDRAYKLILRRHDQEALRTLLDQEDLPAKASVRIRDNYEYFRDQLVEADPEEVYRGINGLMVVDVTLDRQTDDPQLIFESLNSTGMDLSQSDLIRNFVLMRADETEQTRLYETSWSKIESLFRGSERNFDSFARDYLALKVKASKQERADKIYLGFRREYEDLASDLGGMEAVLQEMLRFARYHAAFSLGVGVAGTFSEPLRHLRRLVDVPAILVMRLYDCHERLGTLSETEFVAALRLIESYVFRRAICGQQTRGYWQLFASLAYRIGEEQPLRDLHVGLARQRERYKYVSDDDFRRELLGRDLYGLRVCSHLLDRLENADSREPTDTSVYSIEHVMPQNTNLPDAWRAMLGDGWQQVQQDWLHRLGNLTLTGYNSTYRDHPFETKKTIRGGFSESSVRLNKYAREQSQWTESEMEERGELLANRALQIWPSLKVEQSLIDAENQRELRDRAARTDVAAVMMSSSSRELFERFRVRVQELDDAIVEIAERSSVSYHGPEFFLEILPRKHGLNLLLAIDFNEIEDPTGLAQDATQWKFFVNAQHEGGVSLYVGDEAIDIAMPIVRQAFVIA